MELTEIFLSDEKSQLWNSKGEVYPDPNLIMNIDYMFEFIRIESKTWKNHCENLDKKLIGLEVQMQYFVLCEKANVSVYLKTLFSLATYYISCVLAFEKLMKQLYKFNVKYDMRLKKPKENVDADFHKKVQFIRDKSFIHQDSEQISNPMNKRLAMSWGVTLSTKSKEALSHKSYRFGKLKPFVIVNGVKTESDKNIGVSDLNCFSNKLLTELENRKQRAVGYYQLVNQTLLDSKI